MSLLSYQWIYWSFLCSEAQVPAAQLRPHFMVGTSLQSWLLVSAALLEQTLETWDMRNDKGGVLILLPCVSRSWCHYHLKLDPGNRSKWREDHLSLHHSWTLISAEGSNQEIIKSNFPSPFQLYCTFSSNWKQEASQLTLLSSRPRARVFHNLGWKLLQHGLRTFRVWLELRSRLGIWFEHIKKSSLRYHQGYPNIYFHGPRSSWQVADNFLHSTFREMSGNSAVATLFKHGRDFSGGTGALRYQWFPSLHQLLKAHTASAAVKSWGDSHHPKVPPKPATLLHHLHMSHVSLSRWKQRGAPTDMGNVCAAPLSP